MKREDYFNNKAFDKFGDLVGFRMPAGGCIWDFCKVCADQANLTDEDINQLSKDLLFDNGLDEESAKCIPIDTVILITAPYTQYFAEFFNLPPRIVFTNLKGIVVTDGLWFDGGMGAGSVETSKDVSIEFIGWIGKDGQRTKFNLKDVAGFTFYHGAPKQDAVFNLRNPERTVIVRCNSDSKSQVVYDKLKYILSNFWVGMSK